MARSSHSGPTLTGTETGLVFSASTHFLPKLGGYRLPESNYSSLHFKCSCVNVTGGLEFGEFPNIPRHINQSANTF